MSEENKVTNKTVDFNHKVNDNEFKLSVMEGTPLSDTISACLTYLEHFKNLYVAAIEKNKDQILQSVQKPLEVVQTELVEPPTSA